MKRFISSCALSALCIIISDTAAAEIPFHLHTSLVEITENPNSQFGSKPAYPKYAGVTFITDDDANKFKFDAADVRTQCMALGFAYLADNCEAGTAKALCSSVVNLPGAEKYTSGCCNRKYYSYDDNNQCGNNNTIETCTTASGKNYYHCGCNRSLYPFSGDSDCPRGNVVNMVNSCTTNDENNVSTTYYATCCPASYQKVCDGNHLVGNGTACYRKDGEGLVAKYESCSCSSHYDTICIAGGMIDPSDYCLLNGKKFTKDTNCEGLCQQTSQTNVDAEFYHKVWHCLYKEDGATIKTPEIEEGLCRKGSDEYYYQTCENQGYQKSEADCYNKDIVLRCPQDVSKVWCLDSKYCTGYDVAIDDADYMQKARVEKCPSTDQGFRYRYIEPDCNDCWKDGVYDKTKCANKDTSSKGDSNHCCRLGYVMNSNGVCEKNTCSKTEYPYSQHPLTDIGEVETCYEGNPKASDDVNLMYDPYYGYTSCKSDFAQGEMWKQADENPRMCVCNREIPGKELPYDNADYAEFNGYYKGLKGEQFSCTDNDSSYFGYTHCYIYYKHIDNQPGLCNQTSVSGYNGKYIYWASPITEQLKPMLADLGYTHSTVCVSKYNHYEAADGTKLGDESVRELLVEGCNNGNEEECNECYSISNLDQNENGLYYYHRKFKLKIGFHNYAETSKFQIGYMENCPTNPSDIEYDYKSLYPNIGACYKYCKLSNLAKCYTGDIVLDDNNGNYKIGVVSRISQTNKTLSVLAYHQYLKGTWDEVLNLAQSYFPGYEDNNDYRDHALLGQGKWRLADISQWPSNVSWSDKIVQKACQTEGFSCFASSGLWRPVEIDETHASYFSGGGIGNISKEKNQSGIGIIALTLTY